MERKNWPLFIFRDNFLLQFSPTFSFLASDSLSEAPFLCPSSLSLEISPSCTNVPWSGHSMIHVHLTNNWWFYGQKIPEEDIRIRWWSRCSSGVKFLNEDLKDMRPVDSAWRMNFMFMSSYSNRLLLTYKKRLLNFWLVRPFFVGYHEVTWCVTWLLCTHHAFLFQMIIFSG